MAAKNFKPLFWSKYIQRELNKDLILANFCNYEFEGEVKEGARLKIVGAVKPTVKKYVPYQDIEIEQLKDNSQFLDIDQADYFAFECDDIDKAQTMKNWMSVSMDEAKTALAEQADAYVGSLASKAKHKLASKAVTKSNATDLIDDALTILYKNNVKTNEELQLACSPDFYRYAKNGLTEVYTDNVEMIRKGVVGKYSNALVKISNNLYNDGTDDYNMLRTKKAIAFANAINKVETDRKEKGFADIVKGLHVYGAKIQRPEQLCVIRTHKSA